MKKTFLLFITLFFINTIFSQKIDCWRCSGTGKYATREWIVCSNCKNWASSYKSKQACDICHDNRGHYKALGDIVCDYCNGTGHDYKQEKKANYENSEEAKRRKKEIHDEFSKAITDSYKEQSNNRYEYANENIKGYYDRIPMPTKDELKKILLEEHKVSGIDNWNFDFMEEFKSVYVYSAKIWGDGGLNIKARMDLEDIASKDKYSADISFIFSFNASEQKWNFYYIHNGKVEKQ